LKVVFYELVDVGFGLWVNICTSGGTFEERSGKTRVFGEIFDRVAIDFGVYKGAD
jgi:hypothetical protein